MQVAILSDLHGNSLALAKVLEEIKRQGVTRLLIAGDFIGYYYRPDEVLELLSSWQWEGVKGNHDKMLEEFLAKNKREMTRYRNSFGKAIDIALQVLKESQIKMLLSLPPKKEVVIEGKRILICHGAPWNQDEHIYPDARKDVFTQIAALGYDYVILGNTHYPYIKRLSKTIIINPGSVGQPRDQGSNSSWILADFGSKKVAIQRTRFDPSMVISDIETNDPKLVYLKEVLIRRKK